MTELEACVEWLLDRGRVEFNLVEGPHFWWRKMAAGHVKFSCPASEFPARAVIELQTEEK